MKILAISTGNPKTASDDKGEWSSAIFREPVQGPIHLGIRSLDGDSVADTKHHGTEGQAVCCHPVEHYDYWRKEYDLSDDDARLGSGSLGENLTVENMNESEVCVGDRYKMGSAVVEVSNVRYPCWKQERKTGLEGFLAKTKETQRTGYYLRVIEEGDLQAGDVPELLARPFPEMTIARVNKAIHEPAMAEEAEAVLTSKAFQEDDIAFLKQVIKVKV